MILDMRSSIGWKPLRDVQVKQVVLNRLCPNEAEVRGVYPQEAVSSREAEHRSVFDSREEIPLAGLTRPLEASHVAASSVN
jgi:hypothetical protein